MHSGDPSTSWGVQIVESKPKILNYIIVILKQFETVIQSEVLLLFKYNHLCDLIHRGNLTYVMFLPYMKVI